VWVYRGETTEPEEEYIDSHHKTAAGTWFTPKFGFAQQHVEKLRKRGVENARIVAVAIPKSILDLDKQVENRGGKMPVGSGDTVQVGFRSDLVERAVDEPIENTPDVDVYTNQFKIVQELQSTT